ncbi:hypothetical protein OVY29_16800 [Sphingopyxis sp. SE2]|uniref:hypothetical protein n=1 Tax=Sphingopyxis sp. SE2 TaxID=1586240 RepID=UPI0028BFCFB5|nr:hypothetical protein [Sphingopyxis sp. SE2]MDT7530319.1 hypothetical protein [Sphingopyxis sp. SE2]
MPFSGQSVRACSAQLKLLHGKEAELRVARQVRWAQTRGNEQEIAFWDAVLEDLGRKGSHH